MAEQQDQDQYFDIIHDATEQTKKFYEKIFQNKWLPGMKREMPIKCIFSLQKLKNPVRNTKCQFIECVYEFENLKILKSKHNDSKGYTCINCGSQVDPMNIFQDQKILSILYFDEKAFINNDLQLININETPYFQQAKEYFKPIEDLEKQNTIIFEYYLMQTLLKQKLEMLESMKKSTNFEEFAKSKAKIIIQDIDIQR